MFGSYKVIALAKANDNAELSRFLSTRRHLVNSRSSRSGKTALQLACKNGNIDMVVMLLMRGGDIDMKDFDKNSPVMLALENRYDDIASLLIERGADCSGVTNSNLETPLHVASKNNCIVSAIQILANKSSLRIDEVDANNNTPLHLSVLNINSDIALSLLSSGADFTLRNTDGKTAVDIARTNKMEEFLLRVKERERVLLNQRVEKMMTSSETSEHIRAIRSQYRGKTPVHSPAHPLDSSTVASEAHKQPRNAHPLSVSEAESASVSPLVAGVPVRGREEAKKPKRRLLEKMLAATMLRKSDISKATESNKSYNYGNVGSANAVSSSALSESNVRSQPTDLIASQYEGTASAAPVDPAQAAVDAENTTVVTGDDNLSQVSTAKKRKKAVRAKLKKIQHRMAAEPRNVEVETSMMALIAPSRHRQALLRRRANILGGFCVVM